MSLHKIQVSRFNQVFSDLIEGAILIDSNQIIVGINKAACKILNKNKKTLVGQNLGSIILTSGWGLAEKNWKNLQKKNNIKASLKFKTTASDSVCSDVGFHADYFPGFHLLLLKLPDVPNAKHIDENRFTYLPSVIKFIAEGIIITDKSGLIQIMNPAAELMTGWKFSDAKGLPLQKVFKILNGKTNRAVKNPVSIVISKGTRVGLANNTILVSRDGTRRQIADSAAPIKDSSHRVSGIALVFSDVTNDYLLNERIAQSQKELSTLIGNLNGIAYKCKNDGNWTMEFISSGAFNLTGYHSSELENNIIKTYEELILKEDRDKVRKAVKKSFLIRKPFRITYRIITKDKKIKWVWEQGRGVFDDNNHLLRIEGFITDITDKIRNETKLTESESDLKDILHSIFDGVIVVDQDTRIVKINAAAEKYTGWNGKEAKGKFLTEVLKCKYWESGIPFLFPVMESIKGNKSISIKDDLVLTDRKKKSRYIHCKISPLHYTKNNRTGCLVIFSDVSEEFYTKQALKKRIISLTLPINERITDITEIIDIDDLQKMQDSISAAFGVASLITYPNGKPLTKPSNFCHLCSNIRKSTKGRKDCFNINAEAGKPNTEGPTFYTCALGINNAGASITIGDQHIASWMIGQVRNNSVNKEAAAKYADEIGVDKLELFKALKEIPYMEIEKFETIARSVFILASKISVLAYQNVQQARLISELNRTREELFEKQENLFITQNSIGDGVISTDNEGNIASMNPAAERLTGWGFADAEGKRLTEIFNIVNANTRQPVLNPVNEVLQRGIIVGLANHTVLIAKDGTERQIADSAAPILTKNGSIKGAVLVFSDVTEQYIARKAIQESERALRESQTIAGLGTYVKDLVSESWSSSNILDSILGIDKNYKRDLANWLALIHPEDNDELYNYYQNDVLKGKKDFDKEYRIVRVNDGTERWVHGLGRIVLDDNGNPVRMIGTIQDITERREAQELLKQSEEKFKTLFYNNHAVMLITHPEDGRIIDANKAACNFYGWSYDELLNKKMYEINNNIYESVENTKKIKTGETTCFFTNHKSKNGQIHNVEVYCGFIIFNRTSSIFNIIHDITERTNIENRLKEHQVRLRNIFEAAPVGIGVITNRVITELNETMCKITGYTRKELLNHSTRILYPTEDEYQRIGVEKQKLANQRGVGNLEITWIHKNKSIIYLLLSIVTLDHNDISKGFTFTVLDITDLKKAEEEIKRKDESYKNTIENIIRFTPEGMLVFKQDYSLFSQNKSFDNLVKKYAGKLGYTEAELREVLLREISEKITEGSNAKIKIGSKKQ